MPFMTLHAPFGWRQHMLTSRSRQHMPQGIGPMVRKGSQGTKVRTPALAGPGHCRHPVPKWQGEFCWLGNAICGGIVPVPATLATMRVNGGLR
jgi:hypothetical protein